MAYIIHRPVASPGVTSATNAPQNEAKHTLSQYRKDIAERAPLLNDAVVIYKVTRLPSRTIYVADNALSVTKTQRP
jgi:hypothetical protein